MFRLASPISLDRASTPDLDLVPLPPPRGRADNDEEGGAEEEYDVEVGYDEERGGARRSSSWKKKTPSRNSPTSCLLTDASPNRPGSLLGCAVAG